MKNFIKASSLFNLAGLVFAWMVIFAYFWWKGPPNFHSLDNFQTMARQCTIVALATLGMTFIIISGGIDLSVGSVVAFVGVVIALMLQAHLSPWVALSGGVACGAVWGLVNGFLITRLNVVPFIVTLGTYLLVRGAAKGLANNQTIDSPSSWLNNLTSQPPGKRPLWDIWHLFPIGVWVTIIGAVLVAIVLKRTRFGRHIVAVGSNEQAARLCGVPVERVKLAVYTLAGVTVGIAGLMQYSRLTVGDPTAADGLELKVIAAVVIGGASLNGGQGSILGSLLGAWIMTTISTGCAQMGLDNWVEQMITGAIIVAAVAVDRVRVNGAEITLPLEEEARSGWGIVFAALCGAVVLLPRFQTPPNTAVTLGFLAFCVPFGIVGWVALRGAKRSVQSFLAGLAKSAIGGVCAGAILVSIPWLAHPMPVIAKIGECLFLGVWAAAAWVITYQAILLIQRFGRRSE